MIELAFKRVAEAPRTVRLFGLRPLVVGCDAVIRHTLSVVFRPPATTVAYAVPQLMPVMVFSHGPWLYTSPSVLAIAAIEIWATFMLSHLLSKSGS